MKVMIIGVGTMGAGIAAAFAQTGHEVLLYDLNNELIQRGMNAIQRIMDIQIKKKLINAESKTAILCQIKTIDIYEGKDSDLVIESVPENIETKKKLFIQIDELCADKTIFASDTSCLSITELATCTKRPDKVIGMHFFNPVYKMMMVEVVQGMATSIETINTVMNVVRNLGKIPISVEDSPGFIVNRILSPMINEAIFVFMEGKATAEEIDRAVVLGTHNPIGPLALADFIGLDVCLAILETLHSEFGECKYRPCPLLRKMVRANYLGRKTGTGFYKY